MTDPPFDVAQAQRWFAIELNNLAWDLVEREQRSAAEIERMIHAAHGACFHWLAVGDLLNHLRAQCLLATAYARAGLGEAAVRHAERCLELSREAGPTQTPFDLATAQGCASAAYRVAGQIDSARAALLSAQAVVATFDDVADRSVFEKLYPAF